MALECEMIEIPCFKPTDCPDDRLTCCVTLVNGGGSVSCKPQIACLGEGSYVACTTNADCPFTNPTCNNFGTAPNGEPFNICGLATSTPTP